MHSFLAGVDEVELFCATSQATVWMATGRDYQSHEVVTVRQSTMTIGLAQGVHPDTDNTISIL
jgi:hypothetical protein